MQKIIEAIYEFNRDILKIEPRDNVNMSEDEIKAAVVFITEEVDEFIEAQQEKDVVKLVDSLCDAMYFAGGSLYRLGVNLNDAKALLPKYFESDYRLKSIEPVFVPDESHRDMLVKTIHDPLNAFESAALNGHYIQSALQMLGTFKAISNVMLNINMTPLIIEKCMLAVHKANMTKKRGVKAERGDLGVADAVKPEGWVAPEEAIKAILGDDIA